MTDPKRTAHLRLAALAAVVVILAAMAVGMFHP